jgi:beta-carotene hydroxylase
MAFRPVLSFGALYPASANIASHNLVHHHFDDDGQPDWAAPEHVSFGWNLINLIHFPNVIGAQHVRRRLALGPHHAAEGVPRQYTAETVVAFGLTGRAPGVRLLDRRSSSS